MSFHTAAFTGTVAASSETELTPISDGILAIANSRFFPQRNMQLLYTGATCTDLQRARWRTPKFRQITTPYIRPFDDSGVFASDTEIADYTRNPLVFAALEEIELLMFQDNASTQEGYTVVGMTESSVPAPSGDIYTLRGTHSTTLAAANWTNTEMTWQDSLPAGRYSVVGMMYFGATAKAARLIMDQEFFRPGCCGWADPQHQTDQIFRYGRLG